MRKTKPARHSRIIRKWDGTTVADPPVVPEHMPGAPEPAAARRPEHEEPVFDFEREDAPADSIRP